MGIAERHRGRGMPQEVAHRGRGGRPRIMSQEAKVWRRSWKWKSVKPAPSQARLKGVPDIIAPMPRCIVKDPRHVVPGS